MSVESFEKLAIHGGPKLRNHPFGARWVFGQEEKDQLLEVIDEVIEFDFDHLNGLGWRSRKKVKEFCDVFSSRHNMKYAVPANSATSAIHAAIAAIDPEPGSEVITTPVTDTGGRGFAGENEMATSACLGSPHDVSIDSNEEIFIADTRNSRIRKIDSNGIIKTIAGTGIPWDKGESGKAIDACLYQPQSISHDDDNNLYIGDGIGKIKKVNSITKNIETIAGIGIQGYDGDGGPAIKAKIGCPSAIAFDNNNNLYFSDTAFHVIRKIDTQGIITTILGNGQAGFSPDETSCKNAMLDTPWGLAISKNNRIFISDSKNHSIRTISQSNTINTISGNKKSKNSLKKLEIIQPHGLCLYNNDKMLLISDHCDNKIYSINI